MIARTGRKAASVPRPFCCRRVSDEPPTAFFKPRGVPLAALRIVTMTLDEYEALRLADFEGLYQEDAAQRMGISRQTFGRIVESAHRKIAEALVEAKAIEIKGGEIQLAGRRFFQCGGCKHRWEPPPGSGRPAVCPQCRSRLIHCGEGKRGHAKRACCGVEETGQRAMEHDRCCRSSDAQTQD